MTHTNKYDQTVTKKSNNTQNRKKGVLMTIIIALVVLVVLWGLYIKYVSPTEIALVNFRDFQHATFIKANKSSFIKINRLTMDQQHIPDLSKYKVIYILAHGMNLNSPMRQAIEKAKENGSFVYMHAATNKETDLSNLTGNHLEYVSGYLKNGGISNYSQLYNYSRRRLEKKSLFTHKILPPKPIPRDTFFHLGYDNYFSNYRDYLDYYKKSGKFKENAPRVCLFTANIGPQSGSRNHIDAIIEELEKRELNLVPISGFQKRLEFLKEVKPDLAIILPHGRFASGRGDILIRYLKENHIPLLCPVTIFSPFEKWQKDPRGMSGGIMSQSISVPELDGGIEPITIAALFKNKQGLYVFQPIPERIKRLGDRVSRWLALKSIPTHKKRVAIYYYKGPGRNALDASGLEVVPSLLNLLRHLKRNGYDTGELPENQHQLMEMIQAKGPLIGKYAEGRMKQYFEKGSPVLVETSEYIKWATHSMSKKQYAQVVQQHGPAPGTYMALEKEGKTYIAVAGIRFGNIMLLPQPLPGSGTDDSTLIHGVKKSPPHHYIASYLWVKYGFKADALIHFGTHGSLEFTPEKQVALSADDWPDILVGDLPHIYLYTIDNIGEAMIAKRRSYAVLTSHITPPFSNARVHGDLEQLIRKIHQWYEVKQPLLKQKYAENIVKLIKTNGLHKDLEISDLAEGNIDQSMLERIHDYIHQISESKIPKGLYTIGESYQQNELVNTLVEMSLSQVADCLANIDIDNGKVVPSIKTDIHRFDTLYRAKSRRIIRAVIDNPSIITSLVKKSFPKTESIPSLDDHSPENKKDRSMEYQQILQDIVKNHSNVKASFGADLNAITTALEGGYVSPSPGSDPIRNPLSLPTGRNLFALDAEAVPTQEAWEVGKLLADQIIEAKKQKSGEFPKKVAVTLWGGEFIRGQGTNIAQILYLMGAEPLRNSRGRVHDVQLIPLKKLGRPRIDVVVQTSGQFRDLAASRIFLIDKAVKLAMADNDRSFDNYIRDNSFRMEGVLKEKGLSPEEARLYSSARIFGGVNGNYGTGIMGLVESGDQWEKDTEITERYLQNMGAVYTKDQWGNFKTGLFESALKDVDTVIHPRSSNSNGPLSLDHVYEFMGGLNATVRNVSGKDPDAWFNDLRDPNRPGILDLKQAIWMEVRSKYLNPNYIKALQKGGASSAETLAETYRNTYGWNVMKPDTIDNEIWDNFYRTYIEDKYKLNIRDFFQTKNPYAFQEMTAVMLESVRKGLWQATEKQIKHLAQLHANWVVKHKPGCSGFVCNNKKLRDMITNLIPADLNQKYADSINQTTIGNTKTKDGMVLKKENLTPRPVSRFIKEHWTTMLAVGSVIVFFFLVILTGRLKQKK